MDIQSRYMKQLDDIEELTKRLFPLTYFRRNAGEILEKLEFIGPIILTKDGKPIAKLTSLKGESTQGEKENLLKVKKFVGGYHFGKITSGQIKKIILQQYEKVLP